MNIELGATSLCKFTKRKEVKRVLNNKFRNPNWPETNGLAVYKLNSGLSRTNLASVQGGD